jgi:hypothetical protein
LVKANVADASVSSTAASTRKTPGVPPVRKAASAMPLALVWMRMKVAFAGCEPGNTPAAPDSVAAKTTV